VRSEVELWSEFGKKVSTSRSGSWTAAGISGRRRATAADGRRRRAPPVRGRPKGRGSRRSRFQRMAERQTGK